MTVAVEFNHVSKRFFLQHTHARSFQEVVVDFFRRRSGKSEEFWVLRDISFALEKGQTVGFIGANGAGKSTALKLISRIIEPTSGQVSTHGRVGALLELGAGFHPDLTGRENIYLNASLLSMSRDLIRSKLDEIVAFSELERFIDIPVKHYSSGMYVRLGFSVAVHVNPEILLVDEVLAVGDANFQRKCMDRVAYLRREGVTIVLVSHGLEIIQSLCDHAIWFGDGVIQAEGAATDVVMDYLSYMAGEAYDPADAGLPEDVRGKRWGTGAVRVVGVELYNAQGVRTAKFRTGEPLEVRLRYHAPERVEAPVFGLGIHHQNGTHICGPNTDFGGLDIPFVEGTGYVVYRVPSLSLLEGNYILSVSVHDRPDAEMYDYHDRLYPLNVYRGTTRELYGLLTLNGTWALEENPNGG